MKRTLQLCLATVSLFLLLASSDALAQNFPKGPDAVLTPGDTCHRPSEYRYPEKIAYCKRDVDTDLKRDIIAMYDRERGFSVQKMERRQFKIDHYIPLCAGGSNERDNLWPQHESVYKITDVLEQPLCEKMAQGRLKQQEAINLIREAKNNLDRVPKILAHIESL